MDHLELFNLVASTAKPPHVPYAPVTSLEVTWQEADLDSLDVMMVCVFFAELYGIDDEAGKKLAPRTPQEIFDFVATHKTKEPASLEDAKEQIK